MQDLKQLLDDLDVLRDRFWDQQAMHIREAEVASLMSERKPCVVDAQQVEYRGVEIVDVDRVFHDVVAEVIRPAVDRPAANSTPGHPDREATGMMVSAVVGFS